MVTRTPIMGVPFAEIIRPDYKPVRSPRSGTNTAEGTRRMGMPQAARPRTLPPSSGEGFYPWRPHPHPSRTRRAEGQRCRVHGGHGVRGGGPDPGSDLGGGRTAEGGGDPRGHRHALRGHHAPRDHHVHHDRHGHRDHRWARGDREGPAAQAAHAVRASHRGDQATCQESRGACRGTQDDKGCRLQSPRPPGSPCAHETPRPTMRRCRPV